MAWVKRNLYFLVGGFVAAALLGLAGYYFYSKWSLNTERDGKLNEAYAELKRITDLPINPGNDKINNTENARNQENKLRAIIEKEQKSFEPILPIPNPANKVVTKEDFASALRRTVDELGHVAEAASVKLPSKYNFSFEAQRNLTTFAAGSLEPLSVQLGEVKAICSLLFRAGINSLDNMRRARVSDDDAKGAPSDYLDPAILTTTNELAVLTPYELTFRCFSGELAGVLAHFANAPQGFIVKTINVDPGTAAASDTTLATSGYVPGYAPGYASAPAAAQAARGVPPVLLDEKQLKVTMVVTLVKLLPKK